MVLKFLLCLSSLVLIYSIYSSFQPSSNLDASFYHTYLNHDLKSLTKSATQLHSSDNLKPLVNFHKSSSRKQLNINLMLLASASLFGLCALVALRESKKRRREDDLDYPLISRRYFN